MKDQNILILKPIITLFGYDELIYLIGRDAIDLAKHFIDDNGAEEEQVSKTMLADIISTIYGDDLLVNPQTRYQIIDKMTASDIDKLFPEISHHPKKYSIIKQASERNLEEFIERFGFSYQPQQNLAPKKSVLKISPDYGFYPYQLKIMTKADMALREHKSVMIHMPTGAGKTRTAMGIVAENLNRDSSNLVLWVADREELCQQAFDEFQKVWKSHGYYQVGAYGLYGGTKESLSGIDNGIVVASIQTLLRKADNDHRKSAFDDLKDNISLIVFDEAHKATAKTYGELMRTIIDKPHVKMIGLSATPGRVSYDDKKQENDALASFFSDQKISMEVPGYYSPIHYLIEKGYLAQPNMHNLLYDNSGSLGLILRNSSVQETHKALGKDLDRNKEIIRTIKKHFAEKPSSKMIVFACSVEHSKVLAAALSAIGIKASPVNEDKRVSYSGDDYRAKVISEFKYGEIQVLTNYNILTAGFDAPKTNSVVIARPVESLIQYWQMVGRGMRGTKSGGNASCDIYVVKDDLPAYKSLDTAYEHWDEHWKDNQ